MAVQCPICNKGVKANDINAHIDSGCQKLALSPDEVATAAHTSFFSSTAPTPAKNPSPLQSQHQNGANGSASFAATAASSQPKRSASTFFQTPAAKRQALPSNNVLTPLPNGSASRLAGAKRRFDEGPGHDISSPAAPGPDRDLSTAAAASKPINGSTSPTADHGRDPKRSRTHKAAPLAERVRPLSLDDVCGQDLVGPGGVLRGLIEADRVPSMILWGGAGTGKTTIARCVARRTGARFVELNATASGVAECKRLFEAAAAELSLTGRKTIVFCDEIHRFNKAQQDVFLRPVEAGTITLIGATTENPSFKVQNALLSRCRTFTLAKLGTDDVVRILKRAMEQEAGEWVVGNGGAGDAEAAGAAGAAAGPHTPDPDTDMELSGGPATLVDDEMLAYLAAFSDGDARTALNLLELALSLSARPGMTREGIKASLTKTLVYDRSGDQHYDTISAFHKSVRGGDADAALYYLARMLQSGEDPLFVARRMVVIASEDVGLADNSMLPLATAAYTATQQIGLPEARIPLAHCAVALCLAPKSTRAYRALGAAMSALKEPGVAALPVPLHLRNAPTRLMREMGYGAEYKYPPNYRGGRVRQEYLPEGLKGRRFLEERDLGTEIDPDLEMES